jgi:hypothetical protein
MGVMRYKLWRSNKDKQLHLLCGEGSGAFNALPTPIRHLGPWTGSKEGEVGSLRLAYRVQLAEQGFVIIYEHVSKLHLEHAAAPQARMMDECPQCHGKARVPMHHGLRDKDCPRCGGRGWVRPIV